MLRSEFDDLNWHGWLDARLPTMEGGNAENAGAFFCPAGDGYSTEYQIHVFELSGTAVSHYIRESSFYSDLSLSILLYRPD